MKLGVALVSAGLVAGCGMPLLPGVSTVSHIGYLSSGGRPASPSPAQQAFLEGLRERGYVEGQNVVVDYRWADEQSDRLPALAAELITLNVRVILAAGGDAAVAARDATRSIPIVFPAVSDPVAAGLVDSLAQPGGNITGFSLIAPTMNAKRLELLKELVPSLVRVAVLADPRAVAVDRQWEELRAASSALSLTLRRYDVDGPGDFERIFGTLVQDGAQALVALPSPSFNRNRGTLISLVNRARVPAVYELRQFPADGGLLSYGPDLNDLYRRAAFSVDQILHGASPSSMPVEQPDKFELVINLTTARALGLTVPPTVLSQATGLIQ